MKRHWIISLVCVIGLAACTIQEPSPAASEPTETQAAATPAATAKPKPAVTISLQVATSAPTLTATALPEAGNPVIQPADLEYLGAFRLPEASGGSSWEYSGRGLTYFPQGDPGGEADGFAGSLFGVGHDQQQYVSEISIPAPVISKNLEELNTATTLQPFADITGGMFGETEIPRLGIQYRPAQDGQTSPRLHFVHGQHFQDFQPSHGWAEMDLSNPRPAGPWTLGSYTNYVSSDYLFEIPAEWGQNLPGQPSLATGRFREGVWGGRGPALLAYQPPADGRLPAPGTALSNISVLLLYGVQDPGQTDIRSDESMQMNGYNADDSWWGGAWLTSGERSAVIFVGTKGLGKSWYGFANGVEWAYDCAEQTPPTCPPVPDWPYESRGYWAEGYQPQILFFNPADLAAAANGLIPTWQPQPYASLDLSATFFDPNIRLEDYKTDLAGAVAYDRERGRLYIIERLADGYQSLIHVWQLR